jgi:hypothetical protein
MGWTLSIDFGTTNTAAAYALDGQAPRHVRFSSGDTMPSAVLTGPDGSVVGVHAIRSRRLRPEAFIESPKLLIGQDAVLLGDDEVPVTDLVATVLGQVTRTAARFAGSDAPTRVVLTHPHDWAAHRRAALLAAWKATGIPSEDVRLVPEPIAAATWLATETELPQGATIGVFDYGGGTCDVAVLRRTASKEKPWEVLGHGGRADLGGRAIDLLLLRWARDSLRRLGHADVDTALDADLAALRTLQDEVRQAKEALSELPDAPIPVAVGTHSLSLTITAADFDEVIADEVAKARDLTERVLADAGVAPDHLRALYLTGGSSHLQAVHATIAELLGGRPATLGDPKLVVALGAQAAAESQRQAENRRPRRERAATVAAQPAQAQTPPRKPHRSPPADQGPVVATVAEPVAAPVADRRVFTRPPSAGPQHEQVIRLLESMGFFAEPADRALGLPHWKKWRARRTTKPEGFPVELPSGRVSGWGDVERLNRVHSTAHPGLFARFEARTDHNVGLWGFDGSASVPAYIVLLPKLWLLEAWRGVPAISPLVLTKDVASVRPKRNARWLLREVDQAVNGGSDTSLDLSVHTGNRYAVQHAGHLELVLSRTGAQKVTNILG